jgi:hypothetical protein
MRCRLGIGERTVGNAQGLVDSSEHPQRDGIISFRSGAGILAEPVGKIAMQCLIVALEGLLKMVMGGGKVAEIKVGGAGASSRRA